MNNSKHWFTPWIFWLHLPPWKIDNSGCQKTFGIPTADLRWTRASRANSGIQRISIFTKNVTLHDRSVLFIKAVGSGRGQTFPLIPEAPGLEKGTRAVKTCNFKFHRSKSVLSHRLGQTGAKSGNACFKISSPATNRCTSSFTAYLEARKGKN